MYNFCTLFDRNYASRGLALYHSLVRVCEQPFRLTIVCMDKETHRGLSKLALPHVRLWLVEDIGDAELLGVRNTRPRREFCWTVPGPLMLAMLKEAGEGEVVTYLDADLCFFSDPKPVYDELGDKDIFIHGHRFAPRYQHYEIASGIFNVGLIAVRNAPEGMACLKHWRAQCMAVCELNPEKGYCGDQKYLDEWPKLYENLVVAEHPGICLAPWNVEAHDITEAGGQVMVDGQPLIFYHYHQMQIISAGFWSKWVVQPARGYDFTEGQIRLLYRPYLAALRKAQGLLNKVGLRSSIPWSSPRKYYRYMQRNDLLFG